MNLILVDEPDFLPRDGATDDERGARSGEWRVVLRGRRLDHLRRVHRATVGRELRVGRIGGGMGIGVVEAIDESEARVRVALTQPPPARLPLTLLLSLPRPKTLRRVLQMSATLGLARVVLMNSWRVDKSYWRSPALAPEALREQLLLGLEQGGDTVAPAVESERLLVPFARDRLDALAHGTTRLIAHPSATSPCPRHVAGPITLALGPEGGLLEEEVALFVKHGFTPVSLGPRLLRVEQAIPALAGRLT